MSMCLSYNSIHARITFLLLVFFLFAFAEELPTTAFGVILTTDLGVSPAKQTLYYTTVFTAFSFQPLFGIIAQFVSIYTFCKQKYFAICGVVIGGAMYIIIGCTKPNFFYLFVFGILLNIGLAFCNAIMDGISVEISNYFKHKHKEHNHHLLNEAISNDNNYCIKYFNFGSAGSIQSLSYFFRSFGSLMSSSMLIALKDLDNYSAITLTGIIYLCIVLPFLLFLFPKSLDINLQQNISIKTKKTFASELNKYWNVILRIWRCLVFVFLLNIAPSLTDVFYAFIYCRTYFNNQDLRVFKFMSLIGAAFGGLIYFLFLAKYCSNKRYLILIFIFMQILNSVSGFIFIPLSNLSNSFESNASINGVYGISFAYYIPVVLCIYTLISSLVLMPQLTLAAQMTPLRLETSVFACFIGISHLGQLISASISSTLLTALNIERSHWNNLTEYIIVCSLSQLIPLFGLLLLTDINHTQNDANVIEEIQEPFVCQNEMACSDCDER